MQDTRRFYDELSSFTSFSEVVDPRHYTRLPDDWYVFITDVKGSTRAIEENRYKDVNMAGAATITAVLNSLGGRKIPFVFGGDGATFLVHRSDRDVVSESLSKTAAMVKSAYALEIRIGFVPIEELSKAGVSVDVAKYQVSDRSTLAMINGGGVGVAEKWIKSSDPRAVALSPVEGAADVNGLSCRWNPIPAKRGEMLCILVLAAEKGENAARVYQKVLVEFDRLFGPGDESHPVTESKLDRRVRLKTLAPELKLKQKGLGFAIKVLLGTIAIRIMYRTGWKIPAFDARKYVSDLAKSTDFRKFDDMLRMVRDCDPVQKREISLLLENMRGQGLLYYGLHSSSEALMTCMVFSTDDHIHFVDGAGGGYAMAAKQLKRQMATSSESASSANQRMNSFAN